MRQSWSEATHILGKISDFIGSLFLKGKSQNFGLHGLPPETSKEAIAYRETRFTKPSLQLCGSDQIKEAESTPWHIILPYVRVNSIQQGIEMDASKLKWPMLIKETKLVDSNLRLDLCENFNA